MDRERSGVVKGDSDSAIRDSAWPYKCLRWTRSEAEGDRAVGVSVWRPKRTITRTWSPVRVSHAFGHANDTIATHGITIWACLALAPSNDNENILIQFLK